MGVNVVKFWLDNLQISTKIVPEIICRREEAGNLGKSGKKRRKKRIGYNHLGMFGISLIVLILMLSLMAQSRNLQESLAGYETRAEALSQQIEDEKARTEEIEALKEYMLTDEYTEEAAREKLGLVKENEIIFQEEK